MEVSGESSCPSQFVPRQSALVPIEQEATVIRMFKICQIKLLIFVMPLPIIYIKVKGKD